MGALMRLQFCDVLPKQFDLAGIWQNFARDLVEQRGLAGTVGPEKQSPFAGADRHGYVLRYREAHERLVQPDDLKGIYVVLRCHLRGSFKRPASRRMPGTMPSGMTITMNIKTNPSSMFQRSM